MEPRLDISELHSELARAPDAQQVLAVERAWLGKDGRVSRAMAEIGTLAPEDRRRIGQEINQFKHSCVEAVEGRKRELEDVRLAAEFARPFDPTLPVAQNIGLGSLHPVTQTYRELFAFFAGMGYGAFHAPEVETEFFNFDALNVHPDHPARDMQDTFWCKRPAGMVLRTHASSAQVRAMRALGPELRVVLPAKVFRNEQPDASHEHTFHQMDVLAVGTGITLSNLKWTISAMFAHLFQRSVAIRLRPGFFPFVEPGFEVDMECVFCTKGCAVCKQTRWIELAGCGMVHPAVLRHGNIDPSHYGGFAYGMGISRLAMLRFGIDDIRVLYDGDVRFLSQF